LASADAGRPARDRRTLGASLVDQQQGVALVAGSEVAGVAVGRPKQNRLEYEATRLQRLAGDLRDRLKCYLKALPVEELPSPHMLGVYDRYYQTVVSLLREQRERAVLAGKGKQGLPISEAEMQHELEKLAEQYVDQLDEKELQALLAKKAARAKKGGPKLGSMGAPVKRRPKLPDDPSETDVLAPASDAPVEKYSDGKGGEL
jgi:hypothetical protein